MLPFNTFMFTNSLEHSSPFLYADATVSMERNEYTFDEDNGTVSVCAQIIVPADVLECDVIATLTLTDGIRASKFCLYVKTKIKSLYY